MERTNRTTLNEFRSELQSTSLDDGGHTIIECSNCGAELCDIWVVRPTTKLKSEIVATCCFCNDKSFVHHINGQFNLGHVKGCAIADTEMEFDKDGDWFIQKVLVKTSEV